MIEVIIPALNERSTIRHIVRACQHAPSVYIVHVVVDDATTDDTAKIAYEAGAEVHGSPGVAGKGQLIDYVLPLIGTERVMLCDGDYTRFSPHIAELAAGANLPEKTMRIMVPKYPSLPEWQTGGAPFPFYSSAWGVNSGLRSFPTWLAGGMDKELHGYLVETQLNKEAMTHGVAIEQLYEPSFVQPLRFSARRLEAMETDRQWGLAHGVLGA
jgi:glycosyltransferase involved in cell wall biosynthesis